MGFDIECIINIQSLAGEYFCPFCRLLVYPNEALQTPCSHLYCKPCLSYVANSTRACPYDGYLVTEADSKPLLESNKALAETIGKIPVHCLYQRSGCSWQGPFSECTTHCSGCAFGNSPVVCNRCGVQIVHRQVQEHAQTCPGNQTQAQQPDGVQDPAAAPVQGQVGATPATSSALAPTPSAALPTAQNPGQASSIAQAQLSQAAFPTPEPLHQQQQQYQQYYQQYPGYDPYQQQYQQYYPYQQQTGQQFQQPTLQGYPPQYPGQQQPQSYVQPQPQMQPQPQVQLQQQIHAQTQPQAPVAAPTPSQSHIHAQATANPYQPVQPISQAPQFQGPGHAALIPQNQSYPQPQPYAQLQPVPTQPQLMQTPQYPQTLGQMQYPQPQTQPQQLQPYPNIQAQQYPQAQAQAQTRPPYSQPLAHPPSQPNQLQAQHQSTPAVSGYQSYPHLQGQSGALPSMHPMGPYQQPQQPGPIQGQISQQPTQVRPPLSHTMTPNQQAPNVMPAHGQPPRGPVTQQLQFHPHAQHGGFQVQPRPGMMPAQQAHQHAFPGQGPLVQQQPPMQGQLRPQGMAQVHPSMQNIAPLQSVQARPPLGVGPQHHSQVSLVPSGGHAIPGQTNQPSASQSYGANANRQLLSTTEYQSTHVQQKGSIEMSDSSANNVKDNASVPASQSVETKNLKPESATTTVEQKSFDENDHDLPASELTEAKNIPPMNSEVHSVGSDLAVQESKLKVKEEEVSGGKSDSSLLHSGEMPSQKHEDVYEQNDISLSAEGDVGGGKPMDKTGQGVKPGSASEGSNSNLVPSTDHGRNQLQPVHSAHQQKPAGTSSVQSASHSGSLVGIPLGQSRPQGPGILGPGSAASIPRGPVSNGPPLYPHGVPHHAGHPRNPFGDPFGRPLFPVQPLGPLDSRPEGGFAQQHPSISEFERFPQRPRLFDGRQPDLQMNSTNFSNFPGNDVRNGGMKLMPEGNMIPFPLEAGQRLVGYRDFGDHKQFPGPSNTDAGNHFPSNRGGDSQASCFGSDGIPHPFEKAPHRFDKDSSRFLPQYHPGRSFHPTEAAAYPRPADFHDDDIGGPNLGRSHPDFPEVPAFARRQMDHFSGSPDRDPLGKAVYENRYPLSSANSRRPGEHFDRDELPHLRGGERFGPLSSHLEGAVAFGAFSNYGRPGESPFAGPPHLPFRETLGVDRPGHPRLGEPGFRSSFSLRHNHEGRFHPGEMERFDDLRRRNPGSMMCRICKVECGNVEGLDVHSQSREHQEKAMAMVLSIKQQNLKKQKTSIARLLHDEGGKPRSAGFEGRGNKR
ncbi:hypothetical protein Droror1_Dr00004266 [Drosera rotundifolia]